MLDDDFCIVSDDGATRVSEVLGRPDRIFARPPRVGLVVGTFASVPYVHLHLESRRRHYPEVPLLVHDDASPRREELRRLCGEYGCDFESNASRRRPCVGDVSCFLGGLLWAGRGRLDLLVKMSRRFLPLADWAADLRGLASASQYPTYCNHTESFGFGFRTECVGMAVDAWLAHRIHEELALMALAGDSPFVEGAIHVIARRLAGFRCEAARRWDERRGARPADRDGYAPWDFMGTDRCTRYPGYLWHDSAAPRDYHRLAASWGLGYAEADFLDPNQGAGNGT